MRFLLGVLVGYTLREKRKLLVKVLVTLLVVHLILLAVVLPALALLALSLDVQRERRSRPAQTKVPIVFKGDKLDMEAVWKVRDQFFPPNVQQKSSQR